MRRHTRRRMLAAAIALAAGLTAVAAWRSAEPAPPQDGGTGSTGSDVQHDPEGAQDYWTPDRARNARPAPMPDDD